MKYELKKWMEETGDNIPVNLTKDWYTRDGGKKIELNFKIRGEMPGIKTRGESINSINGFSTLD